MHTAVYESSPSLHIEAARLVECPSGPSLGEFLVVFLTSEVSFFINAHRLVRGLGEEVVVGSCRPTVKELLDIGSIDVKWWRP
jgi:hypothetical protein